MDSNAKVKAPKVHISSDGLECTLMFPMPDPSAPRETYPIPVLIQLLKDAGVVFGIDQDRIAELSKSPIYDRPVVVATGTPSVAGIPGYFEYNFDTKVDKKPVVREDGSTDYMNVKSIAIVHKDQVIATYHPAQQGSRGMTVRGTSIEPKPARDLPPIAGRGFNRSTDNITYISLIDGKIEINGNRIIISSIHEVKGDADISCGNIDFNGDVVVHGGVSDGVVIRAAGTITVEGLVENCELYSGKDMYLKAGIKGSEKTLIQCGGSIVSQFIEYAVITCHGNIEADYIFKSKVSCDGKIDLNGNKAAIIGGYVAAVEGMDVNELGNDFGTITNISVGIDQERVAAVENLSRKIQSISQNVSKIKKGLDDFDRLGLERGVDYKDDPRRLQLLRVKIRDEAVVLEEKAKLESLQSIIDRGGNSTIRVFKKVYAGVNISIDNHKTQVKENQQKVEFEKTPTGIRMCIIDGVR